MDIDKELAYVSVFLELVERDGLEESERILMSEHAEMLHRQQEQKNEAVFQALLGNAGGDAELLARTLFSIFVAAKPPQVHQTSGFKHIKASSRWGEGGVGKLVLFVLVDKEIERLRSIGVTKGKIIQEAIANVLKIPTDKRLLASNAREIKSKAARYSEAKAMIKKKK